MRVESSSINKQISTLGLGETLIRVIMYGGLTKFLADKK